MIFANIIFLFKPNTSVDNTVITIFTPFNSKRSELTPNKFKLVVLLNLESKGVKLRTFSPSADSALLTTTAIADLMALIGDIIVMLQLQHELLQQRQYSIT